MIALSTAQERVISAAEALVDFLEFGSPDTPRLHTLHIQLALAVSDFQQARTAYKATLAQPQYPDPNPKHPSDLRV